MSTFHPKEHGSPQRPASSMLSTLARTTSGSHSPFPWDLCHLEDPLDNPESCPVHPWWFPSVTSARSLAWSSPDHFTTVFFCENFQWTGIFWPFQQSPWHALVDNTAVEWYQNEHVFKPAQTKGYSVNTTQQGSTEQHRCHTGLLCRAPSFKPRLFSALL